MNLRGKKIIVLAISVLSLTLTACGNNHIKLSDAVENSNTIKSGKTNMNISLVSENKIEKNTMEMEAEVKGEFTELTPNTMKFKGEVLFEEFEKNKTVMPIMLDMKNAEQGDIDMFIGITNKMSEFIDMGNKEVIYFNPKTMNKDRDIKKDDKYQEKINKMNKELYRELISYKNNDKENIMKFYKIDGKSKTENGIYEITLEKGEVSKFMTKMFNNKVFLESYIELFSPEGVDVAEKEQSLRNLIKDNTESIDGVAVRVYIIINDGVIVGSDVTVQTVLKGESIDIENEITVKSEITNINEDIKIEMPKVEDENIFNYNEVVQEIMKNMENLKVEAKEVDTGEGK